MEPLKEVLSLKALCAKKIAFTFTEEQYQYSLKVLPPGLARKIEALNGHFKIHKAISNLLSCELNVEWIKVDKGLERPPITG